MKKSYRALVLTLFMVLAGGLALPLALSAAGPAAVNLGSAGSFVILAKSGISTTGTTSITGDIGVSPIAATGMTGFGLIMDGSNTFATSSRLTGKAYAADYAAPTPATMATAISDMETAYTNAAGRTLPTSTELGAGNIGGQTLAPGLYKWSTDVTIPSDVTLSGGANDVWIFQIAQKLTISSATRVILSGGARGANIFWQVGGQTTLGTSSIFHGNILDQTAIVMNNGATLYGRALAQTAVTLDANTVMAAVASDPVTNTNSNVNTNTGTTTNTAPTTNRAGTNSSSASPTLPSTGGGPRTEASVPWQMIAVLGIGTVAALILTRLRFSRRP